MPLASNCGRASSRRPRLQEKNPTGGTSTSRFTHQGSAIRPIFIRRFYLELRRNAPGPQTAILGLIQRHAKLSCSQTSSRREYSNLAVTLSWKFSSNETIHSRKEKQCSK